MKDRNITTKLEKAITRELISIVVSLFWTFLASKIVLKTYRYAVLEGSDTELLDMAYWMEIVVIQNVDQSILYGVSADVDMSYSSKSGNGLDLV
ncbi:hypothetical protein Tco_0741834 [Tanacetum coccineum]